VVIRHPKEVVIHHPKEAATHLHNKVVIHLHKEAAIHQLLLQLYLVVAHPLALTRHTANHPLAMAAHHLASTKAAALVCIGTPM
jgi:hypothetical protein